MKPSEILNQFLLYLHDQDSQTWMDIEYNKKETAEKVISVFLAERRKKSKQNKKDFISLRRLDNDFIDDLLSITEE